MWNRVNRGLPPEMKNESQSLKRDETSFRRKGEILLQSWRDTHVVNMISTIQDSTMVDVPRRNEEVKKKPIFQHTTWVYQKVPRLSSTNRKQMALDEYLRYD